MAQNDTPRKALVLAGGGARGSYQVGVWRALTELGWNPQIITGTSVGSLNGAMFALDLYETVELKPGVRELLARLKAEGARMCICSNTWSDQCKTVLTRLGVDDCFEFYIEAQGPLHKSRPDVFFAALQRLGGTDPHRCTVCEDSLYAARTAHDAGFHVIGIASAADEPALRRVSDQFLTRWAELKF